MDGVEAYKGCRVLMNTIAVVCVCLHLLMLWARFNQHRTKLKLSHEVVMWPVDGNM